jgi:hypothetical protein
LLEGHNRKSIKCPGPQKRLITISDVAELTLQHHVKAGDIIKVQVNLPMSQREHWPAIKTKVLEWAGQLGCDYITVKPQYQTGDRVKLKASGRRSDEDTLKAYAKARGVSPGMVKVGLELLDD